MARGFLCNLTKRLNQSKGAKPRIYIGSGLEKIALPPYKVVEYIIFRKFVTMGNGYYHQLELLSIIYRTSKFYPVK